MISHTNLLIINILYIYINLLKSLAGFWIKKDSKVSSKLFNILIKPLPP